MPVAKTLKWPTVVHENLMLVALLGYWKLRKLSNDTRLLRKIL